MATEFNQAAKSGAGPGVLSPTQRIEPTISDNHGPRAGSSVDAGGGGRGAARRDDAIDRLRGLCLLSMTVHHLTFSRGHSSIVDQIVHALTWVSGAEGFVFLSGVSIGLVWTKRGGCTPEIRRWTLGRGVFLVLVGLVINVAGIAWFGAVGRPDWYPPVDPTVLDVLTSRWALPFSKVLPMYAVFLLLAAVVGPLLVRRPRLALAGSVGLYLSSLVVPAVGPSSYPGSGPQWNLPAWQLLFIVGLLAGTNWESVRAALDRHRRMVIRAGVVGLATIAGLRIGFNLAVRSMAPASLDLAALDGTRDQLEALWLAKPDLGPLRVVLIALIGPAAYLISQRRLPVDRLVTAAGGRSLRVYVVSTLVAFASASLEAAGPSFESEIMIVIITALVLATGLLRPVGRGRAWSF